MFQHLINADVPQRCIHHPFCEQVVWPTVEHRCGSFALVFLICQELRKDVLIDWRGRYADGNPGHLSREPLPPTGDLDWAAYLCDHETPKECHA
jgi:hypothetical protein